MTKLVSNSRGYYRCCEGGNHPLTNQDGHSLDPLHILDQNGQESAKPPSLAICRMRHNIRVFAIIFPFLMPPHLLHCFFGQEQPFQPWRDRYVTKLFDRHFCGNRDSIIICHLDVSGPTAMHTFGVILLLLLEKHEIFSHTSIFS
jgi:hypothetical protein